MPGCVVEVFATAAAVEQYADLLALADQVTLVEDRALASLSDSVTPAGLVALCNYLDVHLATSLVEPVETKLVVICADVRDPGNAGTVIRCADAVGAQAVILAGNSVDAYNPKTVRASVGSLFHLPISIEPDVPAAIAAAKAAGLTVLAADGAGERDLFEVDDLLAGPIAWLFGNEAWGLPEETAVLADHSIRIPILGQAESLNLATAAAVCLYAAARARLTTN